MWCLPGCSASMHFGQKASSFPCPVDNSSMGKSLGTKWQQEPVKPSWHQPTHLARVLSL